MTEEERDALIVQMARDLHHVDGELEIDPGAAVSEGADNGAYVQAWVWVDFNGTTLCKEQEND